MDYFPEEVEDYKLFNSDHPCEVCEGTPTDPQTGMCFNCYYETE